MPRKTTADAVARPIDQRARRELEEQILECGPTVTSLHDIGAGLICQYAKRTEKYHLYARFIANGKRVYAAIGDYPTLTCDEILEDDLNLLDIACSDTLRLLAESAELAHREGEHYLTDGNAMMNALQIVADLITFRRDIANSAFVLRPSRGQS